MTSTAFKTLSANGAKLIKDYEQFRPTAYMPTPRDVPTIGWGHTEGVKMGDTCTTDQAEVFFRQDTAAAVREVNQHVTVTLTQNEFDALVSLCFNIGTSNFQNSTLLQLLNSGAQRALVAGQFGRWNKQKGRVLDGLTARRAKEAALFLHP